MYLVCRVAYEYADKDVRPVPKIAVLDCYTDYEDALYDSQNKVSKGERGIFILTGEEV